MDRGVDMKNTGIAALINTFSLHRNLTKDLLLPLNSDQLPLRPVSGGGIFGKQFRHILDIEI